jgi:hypothetical protein
MKGNIDDPTGTAERLVPLLAEATRSKARVQTALVRAFAESPDWGETTKRFHRMKDLVEELSEKELQMIIDAYAKNDQLHGAYYLTNKSERLKNFLSSATGKSFQISGAQITVEDDHPF